MNLDTPADSDHQARFALWEAIRHAAERIAHSCSVIGPAPDRGHISVRHIQSPPEVRTWQLLEALSLLSVLVKAVAITTPYFSSRRMGQLASSKTVTRSFFGANPRCVDKTAIL